MKTTESLKLQDLPVAAPRRTASNYRHGFDAGMAQDVQDMRCLLHTLIAVLAVLAVAFGAIIFLLATAKITITEEPDNFTSEALLVNEPHDDELSRAKREENESRRGDVFEGSGVSSEEPGEFIPVEGFRDKRQGDCKPDPQVNAISENLDKVKTEVEKLSAHLLGAQTGLQVKNADAQHFPICFFQPDPASLTGQKSGPYFTGEVSGAAKNPVVCVFVSQPAPVAESLVAPPQTDEGDHKITQAVSIGARENRDNEASKKKIGKNKKPLDFWPETTQKPSGLPLPYRSSSSTTAAPSEPSPEAVAASEMRAAAHRGRCSEGQMMCRNHECIKIDQWCDGTVHCKDASDEAICRCRRRIHPVRLCDGYLDCPNGEDEDGCNGCVAGVEFGCAIGRDKTSICLPLSWRCNGVEDCPTGSDEEGCFVLLDELSNVTQVEMESHISGYLHKSVEGTWYPVCNADTSAAVDACKAEVGTDVKPEEISITLQELSPDRKDVLLFSADGKGCTGREVAVVHCPLPQCGTRILSKQTALSSRPITKRVVGGRIVGGKLSSPTAWPYLVAVFRDGHFHCGGSLIRENWVLSAAHCVHDYTKHFYEVQAGMLRRLSFSPQEQTRTVTHVIMHQDYNRQVMTNDLSLLRIAPEVRLSRWARHVCLPPPGVILPEPSTTCITVGWGATKEHGSDPDQIHEVDVPILATCKHAEDRRGVEICAGFPEGGKDACQGDSGGPLLCQIPSEPERWYVAGVVSHGEGCARPDEPGAYTRVGIFLDWINYFISDEKHLPKKVPLAKCPSIECSRVAGRCLAASMVCDKIVDCLNGEDELNCKSYTSRASSNSSSFRFEDEDPGVPQSDREDVYSKYYKDPKVKKAFQTLKDAGMLKNATNGLMTPKYYLHHLKSQDSRVTRALKDLNETGLANEVNLLNVTKILVDDNPDANPSTIVGANNSTDGSPSASESTLDSLNSQDKETMTSSPSPDEAENKLGESDLPTEPPTTRQPSSPAPTNTPESPPPSPTPSPTTASPAPPPPPPLPTQALTPPPPRPSSQPPPENKGGDLDLGPPQTHPNSTDTVEDKQIGTPLDSDGFFCDYGQSVPKDRRCDGMRDCEDGMDEKGCNCKDYLMIINPLLVCNGELDCRDHTDEQGCSICEHDEYLCPISMQCVKQYQICDHNFDCTHYEDEIFCFALVKGPQVIVDQENHAVLRQEGFLSYRKGNEWFYECVTNQNVEKLAADICANMGFSYFTDAYIQTISNVSLQEVSERDYYQYDYGMLKEGTPTCEGLYIKCGDRLHSKPKEIQPCGDATWSWFAAIYKEGKYLCGATLINQQWVMTSTYCTQKIDLSQHYVGVLLGSHSIPGLEGPYEQTRRADSINPVPYSYASLVKMDRPVHLSRQVIPLSLPNSYDHPDDVYFCMALGPSASNGSIIAIQFTPVECEDGSYFLCLQRTCGVDDHDCAHTDQAAPKTNHWSGAMACQNSRGSWYPLAVYDEPLGVCGFRSPLALPKISSYLQELKNTLAYPLRAEPPPFCPGWRCPMGLCVPQESICDGLAECRDKSDEPAECDNIHEKMICLEPNNPFSCVCGLHRLPCGDGYCVPKESFCDGKVDCVSGADEPKDCGTCSSYLRIVAPNKLCDGNRHCLDKSDEDWRECGCHHDYFHCYERGHCIPPSFECDGHRDCPDGEDELNCYAVRTQRSEVAVGDLLINTFGVWHEFCPQPGANLSELNVDSGALCRKLGFSSANAHTEQQQALAPVPQPKFDSFSVVNINERNSITMRLANRPLVSLQNEKCPSIVVVDCSDEKRN